MVQNIGESPTWLLLLPSPPSHLSLSTLRIAYGPGLTRLLKQASEVSSGSSTLVLDIAISFADSLDLGYTSLQSLFGVMYRLICVICTEQQIDLQYNNDVDARLMLFRRIPIQKEYHGEGKSDSSSVKRLFLDLETLAKTDRAWQRLCSLEGETAERLLQDFLRTRNQTFQHMPASQIERLPGGLVVHQELKQTFSTLGDGIQHHHSVAVGGTFDHLHAGHKLLLTMAALVLGPEASGYMCLTVGITGDELLKNKQYREQMQDFHERQAAVQKFMLGILELLSPKHTLEHSQTVASAGTFGRETQNILKSGLVIKYVEIFDPCGPTITDEAISALVLSAETRNGGQVVNDKRRERGWPALDVFEVDVLDAGESERSEVETQFQSKISSTDIRRRVYQQSTTANKNV